MTDTCKGCPQAEPDYDPKKKNKVEPFCDCCTRTVSVNPSADAHKFVSLIGQLTKAKK